MTFEKSFPLFRAGKLEKPLAAYVASCRTGDRPDDRTRLRVVGMEGFGDCGGEEASRQSATPNQRDENRVAQTYRRAVLCVLMPCGVPLAWISIHRRSPPGSDVSSVRQVGKREGRRLPAAPPCLSTITFD